MKSRILVALDIETKSTTEDKEDALNPFKSEITCIGVYGEGIQKVYRSPWKDFMEEVYNNDEYCFVAHNGKFDLKHMYFKFGEMPNWKERYAADTRYMAFVCTEKISEDYLAEYEAKRKELNKSRTNAHREARLHSLKTLAPYFLNVEPFWEPDQGHDNDEYVLKDCQYTFELYHLFKKKLEDLGQYDFYHNKLMEWSKVVLQAELTGIKIDVPLIEQLLAENKEKVHQLTATLKQEWAEHFDAYSKKVLRELNSQYNDMFQTYMEKHPKASLVDTQLRYVNMFERAKNKLIESGELELNLDSPAQLKWLLKERLELNLKGSDGKESTDQEVLGNLALKYPVISTLTNIKKSNKLISAFFPKYIDLQQDSLIHCDFNIDGARTGRLSSSSPNLQQHPRKLKRIFKARPGKKFITYDLGSIEAVFIAYYTGDKELMRIVNENRSVHNVNAIEMFNLNCAEEDVPIKYELLRYAAKQIGFSVLYGAGSGQVLRSCFKFGIDMSERECKEVVKRIRSKYKGVWEFKTALDAELKKGEILYNYMGRPIHFSNSEDVYMKGMNTLIQGSASDLCLGIAFEISEKTTAVPLMFVHDSIVCEVDEENAIEADIQIQKIFKKELTNSAATFTLSIDGGINDVWD